MKVPILAILAVILASLACQQVATPITTATPTSQPAPLHLSPTPTATAQPRPTEAQTAQVRAAMVNVRAEPDGEVVGQLEIETDVLIVACADGWCQISEPMEGYIYQGCLSISDGAGCTAK